MLLQVRDVDLSSLKKLKRLRLVNVKASSLKVRPECSISTVHYGVPSLNLGICQDKELHVRSATFSLREHP